MGAHRNSAIQRSQKIFVSESPIVHAWRTFSFVNERKKKEEKEEEETRPGGNGEGAMERT